MNNKGIAVYCASSTRIDQSYVDAAEALGREIAKAGVPVINGGGSMGLMGAVNNGAIAADGETIGVIPRFMVDRGWHHRGLSDLRVVETMHERKELMASMARGVIALPGGIGTYDELIEIITWRKLGLYKGNIVVYNVNNYFDPLFALLEHTVSEGFMSDEHIKRIAIVTDAESAVKAALADSEEMPLITEF